MPTTCRAYVTTPPLHQQLGHSPQKIPNQFRGPKVDQVDPRVCSAGKLRQGRAHGLIPSRLHAEYNKADLPTPPSSGPQGTTGKDGKTGRGPKAIKVWGASQHCHTQDGGAAVARSLRGGTNACAARSPGSGHKMAAAALGRARRRRQNGRSSRTCGRIPSSPLRAGKSPWKPWSRREPRQGPGVPSRTAEAPPALPARGCRSPGLLRRRHLRAAGGQQGCRLG